MNCRGCSSSEVVTFLNLGRLPLAGGFLKKANFSREKMYPLEICFCKKCYLVQIKRTVPRRILFTDYKYLSSSTETLRNHFEMLAVKIGELSPRLVVEVGSNDGVLLVPLKARGIPGVGVEPAKNVAEVAKSRGVDVIEGWFGKDVAKMIVKNYGRCDVITGSNVFAHIKDLRDVLRGIQTLLSDDGTLIMEVHYLPELLKGAQYDFFYHEHIFYYSLLALRKLLLRSNLRVYRAERLPIHGGSIRIYATKDPSRKIEDSVLGLLAEERKSGIQKLATYLEFAEKVRHHRDRLSSILSGLNKEGKRIAGYGASGRATTLLNYLRLPPGTIEYVVDDSPARQNLYIAGVHIPIFSRDKLTEDPPHWVLLLAWAYEKEIRRKTKLPMIVPFPDVRTTTGETLRERADA